MVAQQADRQGPQSLPDATGGKREQELLAQGWTRRFIGAPPRLKEVIELYQSLGYEVHLEMQQPEQLNDQCRACAIAINLFRIVYTRPRLQASAGAGALQNGPRSDNDGSDSR